MPRLRPLSEDEVSEEARGHFRKQAANLGQVSNGARFSAYFPEMMLAAQGLIDAISQGALPDQLRRLLNVKVASMIGCPL